MVRFSLKNCHCRAEDKVEKKALRKNGQAGRSGPQSVWGRGLDSATSETRLAVFKMGMSVGGGGRGGEGRALPLKPDPPEMDNNHAHACGISLSHPCSLFLASAPHT